MLKNGWRISTLCGLKSITLGKVSNLLYSFAMKNFLLLLPCLIVLSACGSGLEVGNSTGERVTAPLDDESERRASRGKLTGEDGWEIFGGSDDKEDGSVGIGVNSFLWRATLDTLSFMPIASADPFGGVVLTDWYEDPKTPGERYKVNAMILDKRLRADGITVSLFKQKMENGVWRDTAVNDRLPRQLEDAILTRARELRIAQSK